jgi:alpha-glucosidase
VLSGGVHLSSTFALLGPWQFLYWYDRPAASPRRKGGAGGRRNVIGNEPELEFFDHLPTVWDDTRVPGVAALGTD